MSDSLHSLSVNKTKTHEFAVGSDHNVQIFDFRQLKPCYEYHHNFNEASNRCHISWSTNGKYILTYDDEGYETDDFNCCFFWDVMNNKRILTSDDVAYLIVDSSKPTAWVNDHLVVATSDFYTHGVFTVTPNTNAIETIDNFEAEYNWYIEELSYNEKTLQLAGANHEHISIWSHYKLPPSVKKFSLGDSLVIILQYIIKFQTAQNSTYKNSFRSNWKLSC